MSFPTVFVSVLSDFVRFYLLYTTSEPVTAPQRFFFDKRDNRKNKTTQLPPLRTTLKCRENPTA